MRLVNDVVIFFLLLYIRVISKTKLKKCISRGESRKEDESTSIR